MVNVLERKPKSHFIVIVMILVLVILHCCINAVMPDNSFGWIISVFMWVIGLVIVRDSLPLIFIYLFIFSYVSIPFYHYVSLRQISSYGDFQYADIINKVSFLNTLFLGLFSTTLIGVTDKKIASPVLWSRQNYVLFYLSLFLCFYSLIFGMQGESLLTANYGAAETEKTSLHEYFLLFYFFTLLTHTFNSKFHNFILLFMLILYCVKTIVYGGRVEVIQAGLLYGYFKFDFFKQIARYKIFVLMLTAYFIFYVIGTARGSLGDLTSLSDLIELLRVSIFPEYISPSIVTTSSDVYYASMRLLGLIENGVLNDEYRFFSFLSYIYNWFFSFSDFKGYANLASAYSFEYRVGGGGLIHTYFYVWLGYIGVISSAIFIGVILRKFHSGGCNFVVRIYGMFLLVTFPRWWGYSPMNLTKMIPLAVVIYVVFLLFISLLKTEKITFNYKHRG